MKAKIYKPAKTAMQSGRAKYNKWVLKFADQKNQLKDTMMGWNGGSSTVSQIELKFSTCLLYTSPSPRDYAASRMPSSA